MDLSTLRRYRAVGGPVALWAAIALGQLVMSGSSSLLYQFAAAVAAVLGAWALHRFVVSIRRDRLVTDTPLVKIRSAAQGYVKVFGRARPAGDRPTAAPLSSRACVWWDYSVEEKVRDAGDESGWRLIDNATSVEPFALADADAECLVGPVNAEITPTTHDVWYGNSVRPSCPPRHERAVFEGGNFRYTERLLSVGDQLSVTGELRSESELNSDGEAAALLRRWKQDQAALLARFDRNHDGSIDAAEWEAARQAAAAEAQAHMLQAPVMRVSVIGEPTHGEPFLIAPMDAARLVRREKWRATLFLALGLLCAVLCALALERVFAPGAKLTSARAAGVAPAGIFTRSREL